MIWEWEMVRSVIFLKVSLRVQHWHADHVYKHDSNAIEAFLLTAFLAYNIFHAFITLNLKPHLRRGKTEIYWARLLAAELYAGAGRFALGSSP